MSFIYGGNTGVTYDDIQRRRKIAQNLSQHNPRNAGEGLLSIANALVGRAIEKKTNREEGALREKFNEKFERVAPQSQAMMDLYNNPMASEGHKKVLGALMKGGIPGFSRGGTMEKRGLAVVGEAGPELVELPAGAKVSPHQSRFWLNEQQQHNPNWSPELDKMWQIENEMTPPPSSTDTPDPLMDREMEFMREEMREGRFDDANAYQTADMSGIKPSGVGETNDLHASARSLQGLMKSLDDYEKLFADGGSTMWPGERKDQLGIAHRDLQMQMKELYNLGVLNGPDLELMNQILIDPTSISGNVMDVLGVADMEKRIPANINQVRQLMLNRAEPALQQLGIDPQSLMPKAANPSEMTDEQLLQMLQGGS